MTTKADPAAPPATAESPPPVGRPAVIALKALRLIMILGISALLLASATLPLYGVVETIRHIVRLVLPGLEPMTTSELLLSSIEPVDLILLAPVMQVVGIGLYGGACREALNRAMLRAPVPAEGLP
jgi:uncharacterized membrane protein YqhA